MIQSHLDWLIAFVFIHEIMVEILMGCILRSFRFGYFLFELLFRILVHDCASCCLHIVLLNVGQWRHDKWRWRVRYLVIEWRYLLLAIRFYWTPWQSFVWIQFCSFGSLLLFWKMTKVWNLTVMHSGRQISN